MYSTRAIQTTFFSGNQVSKKNMLKAVQVRKFE